MPFVPDPELGAFIQSLPKTETHIHLEGSLPLELARRIAPERFAEPPPYWQNEYRFDGFAEFQDLFDTVFFRWYVSPENYYESCRTIFQNLIDQNCRYLECSFHLGTVERIAVPFREIARAIHAARPPELELRLYLGMFRDHYVPPFAAAVEEAITWDEIAGIDMHGFENPVFQPWSIDLWQRARANGKTTKAHAGEFSPADDVRRAVLDLGVRRVQHGLSAAHDPATLALLVEKEVTLDLTPISNLKLQAVPSLREHPIRTFMEAGVRCTISTDDPMLFGNSLNEEYAALAMETGLTRAELVQLAKNGFHVADLPVSEKADALARLDELCPSPALA